MLYFKLIFHDTLHKLLLIVKIALLTTIYLIVLIIATIAIVVSKDVFQILGYMLVLCSSLVYVSFIMTSITNTIGIEYEQYSELDENQIVVTLPIITVVTIIIFLILIHLLEAYPDPQYIQMLVITVMFIILLTTYICTYLKMGFDQCKKKYPYRHKLFCEFEDNCKLIIVPVIEFFILTIMQLVICAIIIHYDMQIIYSKNGQIIAIWTIFLSLITEILLMLAVPDTIAYKLNLKKEMKNGINQE